MLESYFPVLVFILFAAALGFIPIVAGWVLGPKKPDVEKLSPFECGFEPFEDARIKFDVRYYLLAILFILFDLEIAFLFPWATILRKSQRMNQSAFSVSSRCLFFSAFS